MRSIFKRVRQPAAAAAAAVAIAACGGDGGERLSEAQWIARADAVCAEATSELEALPEPGSPDELAEFAERSVAIAERQLSRLRELRPPEAAEDDYAEMLDLTERQVEITGEIAEAAAEGDQAAVQELIAQGREVDDESDELAAEYDFEECGSE